MKKIIFISLIFLFNTTQSAQSTPTTQSSISQLSAQSSQTTPTAQPNQAQLSADVALRAQQLEAFYSIFPDPTQQQFALLPALNEIITFVYEQALHVPPVIFNAIQRFYAFLQARALEENNIVLENLSEQDKQKVNAHIIELCMNSSIWQNYNKIFITQSLEYGTSLLHSVHQAEINIFTYIPNFETAYYSQGYTEIRNGAELVRLSMVLSDAMRNRSINQCDWAQLTNIDQLYSAIENYQESEIYALNKVLQTLLKDPTKYPFPNNISLINHNNEVSQAFNHFVYKENNGQLKVAEYAQFIMNIDQNNHPYLTALGNFIFKHDTNQAGPYLAKNPVFDVLFQDTEDGPMPQPIFLEILAFEGIKLLGSDLAYYFNNTNLEPTMQELTALEQQYPGILQGFPNILPYMPQDYPYLDAIQKLTPIVAENTTSQASVQGWFSRMIHSVASGFRTAADAIASDTVTAADAIATSAVAAGHAIASAGKNLGHDLKYGLLDFARGTGYFFAAAAMAIGNPSKGAQFFQKSFTNFSNMGTDISGSIKAVGTIIGSAASVATTSVAQIMGGLIGDNQLGTDLAGLSSVAIGSIVSAVVDLSDYAVEGVLDVYRLSAEAVMVLESAIMAAAASAVGVDAGSYQNAFLQEGNYFAKDTVLSILTELTFLADAIGAILTGIMESIAYLCCCLIDVIGDVFGDLAAMGADLCGYNGLNAWEKVKNGVQTWRGTIIGSIMLVGGTALMFTGVGSGLGAAMLVVGTGMMAIGVWGDYQQDVQAKRNMEDQKNLLAKYSAAIPQEEQATQAMASAAMVEKSAQFVAIKQNSERNLVYYQNFVNSEFNNTISTKGFGLGSLYQILTMPDSQEGTISADPGYSYGIKTDRMALNPSGGFYTFNSARNTFAQEIATAPQQTHQTSQSTTFTLNPSTPDLWINQKDLSNVWQTDGFEVEVRWRTIYETEGNFYIGVFVSEKVMNIPLLQALNKNYKDALELSGSNAAQYTEATYENLDTFNRNLLNYNHLSRNFVIFRENGATPSLGLYQHQGPEDGWLNRNIGGVNYQRGVWYRMKVSINGQTTQVKCWEEAAEEPSEWTSFNTTPATKFPTITPIKLPNDVNPFEMIITPAAPASNSSNKPTTQSNTDSQTNTSTWTTNQANNGPQVDTSSWSAAQQNTGPQADTSTWTTAQATNNPQPGTSTWVISAQSQEEESNNIINNAIGSMGIIASGAAVEYQILSPATTPKILPARKKINAKVVSSYQQNRMSLQEQERERQWIIQNLKEVEIDNTTSEKPTPSTPTKKQPTIQQPAMLQPTVTQPPTAQDSPAAPEHSVIWYLQNEGSQPTQTNINAEISAAGKFAVLGGPS